jgi:hypothetical protein
MLTAAASGQTAGRKPLLKAPFEKYDIPAALEASAVRGFAWLNLAVRAGEPTFKAMLRRRFIR